MKRKMILAAVFIVVGISVAAGIYSAVEAAMVGDWRGVRLITEKLWAIVVAGLILAISIQETMTDGKPASAGKE
jgi:uncharacterized membrane protein